MRLRLEKLVEAAQNDEFTDVRGLGRVGLGGIFLGSILMLGVQLAIWSDNFGQFGAYIALVTFFHILEFLLTALFNSRTLSFDSYLLNHSREYHIALASSIIEYAIELLLFPSMKRCSVITFLGVLVTIAGQTIRTIAMVEAGSNFTHQIAEEKRDGHKLVTSGIYQFCRHPSYCGWFWWAVGTQVVLVNPLNIVGYSLVAWKFFDERIKLEEEYLMKFFDEQYRQYRQEVWSGVPGIDGVWIPKSFAEKLGLKTN